jgi:excisionase family DNA binding protein
MLKPLFSVEDVAEYLKAEPRTVRRWARTGLLTGMKAGHRLMFTEEQITQFLRPAEYKSKSDVDSNGGQ